MRLLVLLLLTGCAASGPMYEKQSLKDHSKAQVVVYRPGGFVGSGRRPDILINGEKTCELPQGSYFSKEVTPGDVILTAQLWDFPGTSQIKFNARKNTPSYVRVSMDADKVAAAGMGGLIGLMVAEGASTNRGPFFMTTVSKEQAEAELASKKLSTACAP
jgi:hypothetical protein